MSMEFGPSALVTPANGVTVARLLATPVVLVLVLRYGTSWVTVAAWFALSCTDGVDGWLARRHGTTRSGAFLDPLADKVLVLGAMFALVVNGRFWWVPVAIITLREFGISLYRSWVGRQGVSVPARPLGKAKTVVQDLAVGAALLPVIGDHTPGIAVALLYLAVILTVASGAQYILDGRRVQVAVTPAAAHPSPPARAAGI
jgi:CDP-diacylglycerol---glycerol-3-phosphate 3-phosphatidyltransferase